jgi:hypothetical protein
MGCFFPGGQWTSADITALDAEGRPALTINTILLTVNTVLGEQASRRADIRLNLDEKATSRQLIL